MSLTVVYFVFSLFDRLMSCKVMHMVSEGSVVAGFVKYASLDLEGQ